MLNFVQVQASGPLGLRPGGEGENFNHPDKLHRDKHPYIEYFEDSAKASLRAKFEPVYKSRSSGTQKLGKRGHFAKVSFRKFGKIDDRQT
ncbi:MAG: hypothetical protein V3T59_05740 [Desulfobacterales bacterium]